MYTYIRCPGCNTLIGHIVRLFQAIRTDLTKEDPNANLAHIFDMLDVQNYCCRARLTTQREFNAYLHE
jgi:DNA-directed RNA polymerase subunit N (RpoN/RPB10)